MSILFFGSSNHSLSVLQSLYRTSPYKIVSIVSQPARPLGRKKTLSPTPVSEFAKEYRIPLFTPKELDEKTINYQLSTINYQLIIVADYGLKLPKKLINLPKYGALNIHPSLLPAYRGSSPAQWAIWRGEKETGITILMISEEFDQGKIIAQKRIPILPTDTQETLYERCFNEGAKMLIEVLPCWIKYCQGEEFSTSSFQFSVYLPPEPQPKNSPTPYARKLTKKDGKIDFAKPDAEIERMIRAFDPWPGTWTTLKELSKFQVQSLKFKVKKDKRIKILKVHLNENGKLQIDKLQIEGKTPISWEDFERGYLK